MRLFIQAILSLSICWAVAAAFSGCVVQQVQAYQIIRGGQ